MWKSCHFFCLQSKLKNCELCLCVAYCSTKCSEEDKKDHEKSCFWLKTILQDYLASHRTQHDLARKWKPRPYLISRDLPISIQVFFQQELQNFCRDAEIKKLDLRLQLELLPYFLVRSWVMSENHWKLQNNISWIHSWHPNHQIFF